MNCTVWCRKKTLASDTPRFIVPSNCCPSAGWPVKSPSTTASLATSTSTTGAAITTWSAPNVAVRWNFFPAKWSSWNGKSDAVTITLRPAILFRFTAFAKIAARINVVASLRLRFSRPDPIFLVLDYRRWRQQVKRMERNIPRDTKQNDHSTERADRNRRQEEPG